MKSILIVFTSIQFMCSASAGRAQGVIQEVAADKIHQIAGEEEKEKEERSTLEFTEAPLVHWEPGLGAFAHNENPPIIAFKPTKTFGANVATAEAANQQMGKILGHS